MAKTWEQIADHFYDIGQRAIDMNAITALAGIEDIARCIGRSPRGASLFGWSSVYDLCIQQVDVEPYTGPYLRISPLTSGLLEFRYMDTAVQGRQWHRTETPSLAVRRLESFFKQMGWFPQPGDPR